MPNSLALRRSQRSYHCACGAPVFLHNSACLSCHRQLGYESDRAAVVALHATERLGEWTIESEGNGNDLSQARRYHRCANYHSAAACNWLRPVDIAPPHNADGSLGDDGLCLSCSLNRTVPDQSLPENRALWYRIEVAKRRLVRQLLALGLPVRTLMRTPWQDAKRGLAFDFLRTLDPLYPVMTGHANGVITLDAQEADDVVRETNRKAMNEPYRTLLGHMRHEVAHYYWDRLVADTQWIEPFRKLFGDERKDYGNALQTHYAIGAPFDWQKRHVSAYASSHPWEDWAETWAHYMHMRDGMDTARSFGLEAGDIEVDRVPFTLGALWDSTRPGAQQYLDFINQWLNITAVLNELSGSMGERDFYPFVLPAAAVAKLQLVHEVVKAQSI
jgi:hypothetical protein